MFVSFDASRPLSARSHPARTSVKLANAARCACSFKLKKFKHLLEVPKPIKNTQSAAVKKINVLFYPGFTTAAAAERNLKVKMMAKISHNL